MDITPKLMTISKIKMTPKMSLTQKVMTTPKMRTKAILIDIPKMNMIPKIRLTLRMKRTQKMKMNPKINMTPKIKTAHKVRLNFTATADMTFPFDYHNKIVDLRLQSIFIAETGNRNPHFRLHDLYHSSNIKDNISNAKRL